MNWIIGAVIGWMAFSALTVVWSVGRERKPVTPGLAVGAVIVQSILIVLIIVGVSIV